MILKSLHWNVKEEKESRKIGKREQKNKKREERIENGRETAKEKQERRLCSICFLQIKTAETGKES